MAYNTKATIKDVNGKPVPQYFNKELDRYEAVEGNNGMFKTMMVDSQGNEIISQNIINQILGKLDNLIEVVS